MAELLCDRRDLVSKQAQVSLGQGWSVCLKQYISNICLVV